MELKTQKFTVILCCVLVAQPCPSLCNHTDCSPPRSSVHGILQARRLEWGCHFLLQGNLPHPGLEPSSLALQGDFLPFELPGTRGKKYFEHAQMLVIVCKKKKITHTHWKRPWCRERLKAEGKEGDDRGWDGWMASPTQWRWVCISSRRWWWTGRPGVLQSMGSQRVGRDWMTEQQLYHAHTHTHTHTCSVYKPNYMILGLPRWHWYKEPTRQCKTLNRPGFDPWVRKIPWRSEWQPTPVFLPGESRG